MKKGHLLLIIILLIIVISCIWFLIKKPNTESPVVETPINALIEKVNDRNNYYMVENCVNKFYSYYISVFENKNPEEEDVKKLYNLLDEEYIGFYNITEENLPTILPKINDSIANIYNMYASKQSENIYVYIVSGILREKRTNELTDFQIMIKIDLKNKVFSVLLKDYIENQYPDLTLGSNLTIESINNIEKNRNNAYVYEEISDKTHVLSLFERYKEEAIYNIEKAYEDLDETYKISKFETIEKFKEYIENNKDRYNKTKLNSFKKTEENGYIQYVCIDEDGYYYIFRETELIKYTLILDTYTIDLPEFLEKYNSASSMDKIGYNIQKVLDAINCKDYEYVYSKLDFEFKAVNYPTIEKFKQEIQAKMFNQNEVAEVSSYNEGSTYAFKLTIVDVKDNTKKQDMTIIMQLKDGTDFVMSFSFSK